MMLQDLGETLTQLKSLGFCTGAEIWLKLSWDHDPNLCPTGWPFRKEEPEQIVLTGTVSDSNLNLQQCIWQGYDSNGDSIWIAQAVPYSFEQIAFLAEQGATIHFYPNQPRGGISNNHVAESAIVFYEIDRLDLEEQWHRLYSLSAQTRLYPNLVVFTGKKSLHVYFRLTEAVKAEPDWRRLARKLCIVQNGDNKVTNPARAMRLAGLARRTYEDDRWQASTLITIEQWSRRAYTPEAFESALDSTGLFPFGLTEERWMDWVSKRNQQIKGKKVDPSTALTDPTIEVQYQQRRFDSMQFRRDDADPERTEILIQDALSVIPPRKAGDNTYETYRAILAALKNYYGEETAISIMENHSPSRQSGWNIRQVCRSSKAIYGIGFLFYIAEREFGWKRPSLTRTEGTHSSSDTIFNIYQELNSLEIEIDQELSDLIEAESIQKLRDAILAFKAARQSIKHRTAWIKKAIANR